MKNILLFVIALFSILHTKAQCPAGTFNNTGFFPGFVTPLQPGIANENTAHAAWAGDYYLFSVVAGNTYVFRSCFTENAAINTLLSLYTSDGLTLLAFNDNFCGQQSQVSWLATFTGQVRLSYYLAGCVTANIDTKLGVYYTTPCTTPSIFSQPLSTTICANYNTSFTVASNGTAPFTYQWQVNTGSGFNNISDGGVYNNATTPILNITNATASLNTYQYRCIVTNSCGSATSTAATLTVNVTNNWTGAVNSDWFTAGNWSCGAVPTQNDNVVISSGNPVVGNGNTAVCKNLSKSGFLSTVNLNNATLQVYGDLNYTSGSFLTNSASSFQLKGTTVQSLLGATPLNITNLVVDNGTGVVMNKTVIVSGALTLQNGKIYTNNFSLFANAISGASPARYVVTGDISNNPSTNGGLRTTIATGNSFTYPIGATSTSYNPCTIQNTAGPSEDFNVRVNNNPLPGAVNNETVQRTWQIDETTVGGNTASLTLQWNEVDEGVTFLRNNCGIYKSNGTSLDYTGYTAQDGGAVFVGGTAWQKQLTGITTFSPWGVTSTPAILPIQFKTFVAERSVGNKMILYWEVAYTNEIKHFEILKSNDGLNFSPLKVIPVSSQLHYSTIDYTPYVGINFYKLKMVTITGETKYTDIIKVNSNKILSMEAWVMGNPVKDELNVQLNLLEKGKVKIQLLTLNGQLLMERNFILNNGSNKIWVDIKNYNSGQYQMIIQNKKSEKLTHTIIKL